MSIERIYWDSDCFLAHLQAEAGKVEKCDGVLERAERGDVMIVTSALTLTEVLWMRTGPRVPKTKADIVSRFFRKSFIRVVNVTRQIAEQSRDLVWENDIRPKDSIHLATALNMNVVALETFDAGLLKKSGLVGLPPLLIREPQAATQIRMPLVAPSPPDA